MAPGLSFVRRWRLTILILLVFAVVGVGSLGAYRLGLLGKKRLRTPAQVEASAVAAKRPPVIVQD